MGKHYFISDIHLGTPSFEESRTRELKLVRWLSMVEDDALAIYFVGDIFDFWYEYKTVVPKGFLHFLGKVAELRRKEIPIYFFIGNHDIWMFDYFEKELGIPVYREPQILNIEGKKLFVGHGDGLGPKDKGYKFLKKVFHNRVNQFLFRWLHPDIGTRIASYFSRKSRHSSKEDGFKTREEEWLWQYAERKNKTLDVDYYIFGHRHIPLDLKLTDDKTRYLNLGDFMFYFSYAVFDGTDVQLNYFEKNE